MTSGACKDVATAKSINCAFLPRHALAMSAALGNKHAQLELGKRFETGRGVERDFAKAEKLYQRASQTTGGAMSMCVWNEYRKTCDPITINLPYDYGLPEAKERLDELRAQLASAAD